MNLDVLMAMASWFGNFQRKALQLVKNLENDMTDIQRNTKFASDQVSTNLSTVNIGTMNVTTGAESPRNNDDAMIDIDLPMANIKENINEFQDCLPVYEKNDNIGISSGGTGGPSTGRSGINRDNNK